MLAQAWPGTTCKARLSKQAIAHWVQHGTGGYRTHIDDYLWAAPIAAVYVADVAGAHPLHGFWERTVLLGECVALNQVLTDAGKRAFHLERPDASNNQSFPSGHSSVAFMGATFLAKEVGHHRPWVQVAGYTVATATGALRMVNNRHYLPDVLAGAAIGILSTEAMYGLHAVAWPHHWRRGHAIVPVWH